MTPQLMTADVEKQAAPAPPQQATATQQALTQAQRIRLWNNCPEYHGDVVGRDAFERLVKLVESVHRIGEPAPQRKALTDEQLRAALTGRSSGWITDTVRQIARDVEAAHGTTQPSQQEQTK